MKKIVVFCLLALSLLVTTATYAQSELIGVWQRIEETGLNVGSTSGEYKWENVQPSIFIFLEEYYSIMYVEGEKPRAQLPDNWDRETMSEEQVRSVFSSFIANSGKYSADESSFTIRPAVALIPNFMEGGSVTYTYKIENDILTMSVKGEGWHYTQKLKRLK